jgi:hypothetical protein
MLMIIALFARNGILGIFDSIVTRLRGRRAVP